MHHKHCITKIDCHEALLICCITSFDNRHTINKNMKPPLEINLITLWCDNHHIKNRTCCKRDTMLFLWTKTLFPLLARDLPSCLHKVLCAKVLARCGLWKTVSAEQNIMHYVARPRRGKRDIRTKVWPLTVIVQLY